jgi:hypothetical protein
VSRKCPRLGENRGYFGVLGVFLGKGLEIKNPLKTLNFAFLEGYIGSGVRI